MRRTSVPNFHAEDAIITHLFFRRPPLIMMLQRDPPFTPVMLIGPAEVAEVARLSNNKTPLSDDGVQVPHSIHGDHTVKIIDCQTGSCLKVLSGHRRTPWVVRFHPLHPEILASGSLDHEVRLWDANTVECIGSCDFYCPIAFIAFHAQGEVLAVASGHKLYIWHYNRRGEASSPTIVLKTRRSLRVLHFHPHAAPFLLTAEVSDLDSPDSPMAIATSAGYPLYPPPAVFFANVHSGVQSNLETNVSPVPAPFLFWPSLARDKGRTSNRSHPVQDDTTYNSTANETENAVSESTIDSTIDMETTEEQPITSPILDTSYGPNNTPPVNLQSGRVGRTPPRHSRPGVEVTPSIYLSNLSRSTGLQMLLRSGDYGQLHQFFPFGDPMFWELPFLQGWLMGQSQAGLNPMLSLNDALHESSSGFRTLGSDNILASDMGARNVDVSVASSLMATCVSQSRLPARSGIRHHSSRSRSIAPAVSGDGGGFISIGQEENDSQLNGRIESDIATSLAAAATAELPCTDVTGASTSPTRHLISALQIIYEFRVYSLEEAMFSSVLASRAIRAAYCLTSIQRLSTRDLQWDLLHHLINMEGCQKADRGIQIQGNSVADNG
ncbi:hypothetical protein GIB67_035769 [Kingdonia uniflora]|uniref:Uncharacterized protein n=1 Tax=Kingdonia uniflora TaxID=39325 RepID=A0A7J7MJN0_9MAGN|nr:hypothetical protein GIB67_035769 [Kingdonia uniflora]